MRRSQRLLLLFSVLGAIAFLGVIWQSFFVPEAETAARNIAKPEQESDRDSSDLADKITPSERLASSVPIAQAEPETHRTALTASELVARVTQPGSQCLGDDGPTRPLVACVGPAIAELFETEVRDDDWATATEQAILTGISQMADIATITTFNVECRETLCRSYIGYLQQEPGLTGGLLLPLLRQAGLQNVFVPHPLDVDSLSRTYFLLRSKNDLPAER